MCKGTVVEVHDPGALEELKKYSVGETQQGKSGGVHENRNRKGFGDLLWHNILTHLYSLISLH